MPAGLVEPGREPDRVRELEPRERDPERGVAVGATQPFPRSGRPRSRCAIRCDASGGIANRSGRASVRYQSQPRSIGSLCYAPCPDDLAARLIAASELHGDFVLSSGRRSNVYFDKFRFLTDPTC